MLIYRRIYIRKKTLERIQRYRGETILFWNFPAALLLQCCLNTSKHRRCHCAAMQARCHLSRARQERPRTAGAAVTSFAPAGPTRGFHKLIGLSPAEGKVGQLARCDPRLQKRRLCSVDPPHAPFIVFFGVFTEY